MKGNKHIKFFDKNMKIIDMLESFIQNFGISKNALNRIQFLYNATLLNNLDKNMTLDQFNIRNNSRINVIDQQDVIGA